MRRAWLLMLLIGLSPVDSSKPVEASPQPPPATAASHGARLSEAEAIRIAISYASRIDWLHFDLNRYDPPTARYIAAPRGGEWEVFFNLKIH
jgi:hypothetical protein